MPHSQDMTVPKETLQPGYAAGIRKPRILLIESDTLFRRTLATFLTKQGFAISVAANLIEALEFLSQLHYSYVIYNLKKPLGVGYKELELLVNYAENMKVLVTTNFSDSMVLDKVRALGAKACLVKPFKRVTILEATEQSQQA